MLKCLSIALKQRYGSLFRHVYETSYQKQPGSNEEGPDIRQAKARKEENDSMGAVSVLKLGACFLNWSILGFEPGRVQGFGVWSLGSRVLGFGVGV